MNTDTYIADKKVLGTGILENQKTPAGKEIVEVLFEDGSKEVMPKLRYEMIATNEISDATGVQNKIASHVGATVFGTMHEFGILLGEVEEVLNQVSNLTNSGYEKARDIVWGTEHHKLPLNKINTILLENYAKENTNGTSSTGSGSDSEDTK